MVAAVLVLEACAVAPWAVLVLVLLLLLLLVVLVRLFLVTWDRTGDMRRGSGGGVTVERGVVAAVGSLDNSCEVISERSVQAHRRELMHIGTQLTQTYTHIPRTADPAHQYQHTHSTRPAHQNAPIAAQSHNIKQAERCVIMHMRVTQRTCWMCCIVINVAPDDTAERTRLGDRRVLPACVGNSGE